MHNCKPPFMSGSLLALMWVFQGVVFGAFLPHSKNQYVKSNITGLSHSTPPSFCMGIMWNFRAPEKISASSMSLNHSCHLQKSRNFPTEFVARNYPPKLPNLAGEVESQGASERNTKIYDMAKWLCQTTASKFPLK